jgi:His-Xaa-Ser system protein HxsD
MIDGMAPAGDVSAQIWDKGGNAVLEVDATIYPIVVALAAGYKFTDRAYVWLQSSAHQGRYLVFLKPKSEADDLVQLAGAFSNEMLDQALRHQLEERFAPLRTIITAQAFAEGNLLDVVADAESVTEPLG